MTTSIWEFLLRFPRKDVGRVFRLIIKFFQTDQKIANASNDYVYQRICVNIFSEGRLKEKYALSAYVHLSNMIKVYFKGRQQDVSKFHWLVWGGGSPPKVSTPFLPGYNEVN